MLIDCGREQWSNALKAAFNLCIVLFEGAVLLASMLKNTDKGVVRDSWPDDRNIGVLDVLTVYGFLWLEPNVRIQKENPRAFLLGRNT